MSLDEIRAELEKSTAEVKALTDQVVALTAQVVRGGPVNTASLDREPRIAGDRTYGFEELVKDAERDGESAEGIRKAKEARRKAEAMMATGMLHQHAAEVARQSSDTVLVKAVDQTNRRALLEAGLEKSAVDTYDFEHNSIQQILLPDMVKLWGMRQVPLLERTDSERAVDITDRWEDVQVAAPAENAQPEGIMGAALNSVAKYPVLHTNTCQIVSRLIEVSGSALRVARNGVYGRDLADLMAFQLRVQLPEIVSDIAYSAWFTVEATQDSVGPLGVRKMSGFVGPVGTFNGQLAQKGSLAVNNAGGELDEATFKGFLRGIAELYPGKDNLPTALYVPLEFQEKIASFEYTLPQYAQADAEKPEITAGYRVTQYWAPWGASLDIIWEPQNLYSATAANNWIVALCESNCAMRNLAGTAGAGGLDVIQLPQQGDRLQTQILWEGCNRAEVYAGHGVLTNFTVML